MINYKDAKIKFFTNRVEGKKVLDIGVVQHDTNKVNNSTWLHRAIREHSSSILGIDIDKDGVHYLNKEGYSVVCEDAETFSLDDKYQVVTAGDLIEHLSNPGMFLDRVKEHLSDDGVLLLSTPNPFWWRWVVKILKTGSAKPHIQHTCWFCEDTMRQLMERHGFYIDKVDYCTIYVLSTFWQYLTRVINPLLPLPKCLKHNTVCFTAKIK